MKKRWMALLGAAAVTINLFAGCGSAGAEQTGNNAGSTATEAAQGKDSVSGEGMAQSVAGTADTVIVAMSPSSEPAAGFNPCINWGCGEHCHEPLIQSTLIRTNVDMEFENDLATDYSVSEDGMTWTFHIRDDVKFTDGEPLTASDVAFTFNTALATPNSEADLSMLDSVEAVDANPDYYGDEVRMKKVIVLFMEEDAALAAVKAGQVDIAYTSAVYSDEQVDGYQLLVCKSVDSRGISLPSIQAGSEVVDGDTVYAAGNDVTCDVALRRAMNYALDRQTMIDHVLNGYGEVAYSVSDNMPWSSESMIIPYDVDKAEQILADGGWSDTDGDGIVEKDGQKAEFTVYYSASDSVRQALTAEFSNQMKAVGINVLYEGLGSWDELYTKMYSDPIIWGWGSNSPVEDYQLYYTGGSCNFTGYSDAKTDELLDAALAATDMNESYRLWQQAQEDVGPDAEALWVWFANVDHLYFARDGLAVAEQKLHPHGHGWSLVNNVDQWTWE